MIGRIAVVAAGIVAAVAGAAALAKRKADQDEARDQEMLSPVTDESDAEALSAKPSPTPSPEGDDLQAIKGIGSVSASRLLAIDVTTFAQIAEWSADDIESVGAEIKVSPERIKREDWVGQAAEQV